MNIEDRHFGFEFEVAASTDTLQRRLINRLRNAGYLPADYRYAHNYHCECDWCIEHFRWDLAPEKKDYNERFGETYYHAYPVKVQTDSSCGVEVITAPIAWGDPRWREFCAVLEEILTRSPVIPTDNNCGFHVHVEAEDLDQTKLGYLAKLTYSNEAVLFRLASGDDPQHRGVDDENGAYHFCMPLSAYEGDQLEHMLFNGPAGTVPGSNKYTAVNYRPLSYLGTVEFRLWNIVRTAWQLELYVDVSVGLVQRASMGRVRKNQTGKLGAFTRSKNEQRGKGLAQRLLRRVGEALPKEHHPPLTERFWRQFEGKEWQPSWQKLSGLHSNSPAWAGRVGRQIRVRPDYDEEPPSLDAPPVEGARRVELNDVVFDPTDQYVFYRMMREDDHSNTAGTFSQQAGHSA